MSRPDEITQEATTIISLTDDLNGANRFIGSLKSDIIKLTESLHRILLLNKELSSLLLEFKAQQKDKNECL
jgi:hypothetical protein